MRKEYKKIKNALLRNYHVLDVWKDKPNVISVYLSYPVYTDKKDFWKVIFTEKYINNKALKEYLDKHPNKNEKDYIVFQDTVLFLDDYNADQDLKNPDKYKLKRVDLKIKEYL